MENEKQPNLTSFTEKTLARIKSEGVVPRPRWHFLLTENAFWVLSGVSVLVGASAVSASIFAVENVGWRYYLATQDDFTTFFLSSLPYLWISTIAVFAGVGYYNFRHTKRGYRYSYLLVLPISIIASFALGTLFYNFGFGEIVDEEIGGRLPFHRSVMLDEQGRWAQPDRGALGGVVLDVEESGDFTLHAFDGNDWIVDASDLTAADQDVIRNFPEVRVVGIPYTESGSTTGKFHACFVFAWDVVGRSPWRGPQPSVATSVARMIPRGYERNGVVLRSNECRGVRPYAQFNAYQTVTN